MNTCQWCYVWVRYQVVNTCQWCYAWVGYQVVNACQWCYAWSLKSMYWITLPPCQEWELYQYTCTTHTYLVYRTSCITLINNVSWTCDLLESHKYTKIKHKNDIKKCYSKFLWFNWKKGMFMVNVIRKLVSYIKKNLCMLIYTLSKEKIIILHVW